MLLPSMTSKRIACGPPFHNFTFYSIPQNRADGGRVCTKKASPLLGEGVTEGDGEGKPVANSCCIAMSRAFDRAVLSLCLGVSVSSLALSGACAPALPEGEPFAAVTLPLSRSPGRRWRRPRPAAPGRAECRRGWRQPESPPSGIPRGQSPAHWVQPMQSSGSTNAFMLVLPPFKNEKKALRAVWPGGAENML